MQIKLQFGLKWFLLATTLVAVLAGTVGKRVYDWSQTDFALERRTRAIQGLEEFGAYLERRDEAIVMVSFPDKQAKSRYFRMTAEIEEVEDLRLSMTGFRDADSPTLAAHPMLRELRLSGNPGVTDKTLKSIARIKSLQMLELAHSNITDEGLKDVARLPKLRELYLSSTPVTTRGLDHLLPMQSLHRLVLVNTNVDDEGLAAIGKLRGLRILDLDKTKVDGPGLVHLAKLPNLMALDLNGCSLQDGSGLAELKQVKYLSICNAQISPGVLSLIHKMENLRDLNLSGSGIDDEQLAELANAKQLTSLSLGNSGGDQTSHASAAALSALRAKLPNTRIFGEPRDQ
ncbi:MAG: leucine-rich repeat domain-containing protein [Pirellulaceae bacterium]